MPERGRSSLQASEPAGELQGTDIRARRAALNLSQTELASILGVTPTTLARWERGEHRVGNSTMVRIALNQLERARDAHDASEPTFPAGGANRQFTRSQRSRFHIPADLSSFIGREEELRVLSALLPKTRLLTLTGPGGVGKTRLAVRLAANVQDCYADGICIAELSTLDSPDLLASELAAALDIRAPSGVSHMEALIAALSASELLLVLDNCDQLAEACGQLVAALLHACPGLRVMATSRTLLRVRGETVWDVPCLELPDRDGENVAAREGCDAVRLFVERANAARPGFGSFEDHEPAIVELCHRLDGLPLALELAAARLSVLTPVQLVSRLDNVFALLVSGASDAPDRQRTLRATLEWSYGLIAEADRVLLARLSVFAGGATLAAVEAVCADIADGDDHQHSVLDLIDRLIAASLVLRLRGPDGSPRFDLLQTIRAYAAERLELSGETEHICERHARYYATLPSDPDYNLWGPRPGMVARRLQMEADNLRAAAAWARDRSDTQLGFSLVWNYGLPRDSWYRRGSSLSSFHDVAHWGEIFLAMDAKLRGSATIARARAMVAISYCALFDGRPERARLLALQAQREFQLLDDAAGEAYALHVLGYIAQYSGDPGRAEASATAALELARCAGTSRILTWALVTLGVTIAQRGGLEEGRRCLEDALTRAEQTGEDHVMPRALLALGSIQCRRGELESAAKAFCKALRLGIDDFDPPAAMLALDGLARIACESGEFERAARFLGVADELCRSVGYLIVRNPYDPASHDQLLSRVRGALGEAAFDLATQAGKAVSLKDIVSEALQVETFQAGMRDIAGDPSDWQVLTERQRQVVELVARGLGNRQIAEALVVSQRTVESHVSHILNRLGLESRVQLGVWGATNMYSTPR